MRVVRALTAIFTGPDGETIAIGRLYSVPMLVVGLGLPIAKFFRHETISLEEFAVELPALAGALTMMIAGTNHIDTPGATLLRPQGGPV